MQGLQLGMRNQKWLGAVQGQELGEKGFYKVKREGGKQETHLIGYSLGVCLFGKA